MFIIEKGANHRSLWHVKVSKRRLQLLINQHFLFFPHFGRSRQVASGQHLRCLLSWQYQNASAVCSVLIRKDELKAIWRDNFDFNACTDRLTGPCTTYAVYCWARWKYDSKVILRNAQNTFYVWFCTDRNLQESVFSRKHLKKWLVLLKPPTKSHLLIV